VEGITEAQEQGAKLICLAGDVIADAASLQASISDDSLVAAATPGGGAVLLGKDGILLEQQALHVDGGADAVGTVDTAFGRLAVLPGRDVIFPETMRLAALQSVSTVLVPASLLEDWEGRTGIVERAAENRVNVVVASARTGERGSLIASLQKDFTIMTEWQDREFDGLLSAPEVLRPASDDAVLLGNVHPLAARNKECSRNTHLLASRPWRLLQPIIALPD